MNHFNKEELLSFNEVLLGRGMPTQQDGIGYNKADYGACSTYFIGLSNGQLADLAKRLVKYSVTQLGIDKEMMKSTAEHLLEQSNGEDRSNGISIDIRENGTLVSFRYNESFIEVIRKQKRRKWDELNKNWIIPNENLINVLNLLKEVGADVDNSIEYANNHKIIKELIKVKEEVDTKEIIRDVLVKLENNMALLKFDYNQDLIERIKSIDSSERQWNQEFKFWAINLKHLDGIANDFKKDVVFKYI